MTQWMIRNFPYVSTPVGFPGAGESWQHNDNVQEGAEMVGGRVIPCQRAGFCSGGRGEPPLKPSSGLFSENYNSYRWRWVGWSRASAQWKGPLTPWDHGFSETQHSYSQLPEHFIWKRTMDISLALRGAGEPQGQVVQGGGQLPGMPL